MSEANGLRDAEGCHLAVGHGTRIPWLTYRRNLRIDPERFPKALYRIDGYLGVVEIPRVHRTGAYASEHKLD